MKRLILITFNLAFIFNWAYAQELSQTIRGTIIDIDSELPLIGVQVIIPNTEPLIGTTTDADGRFRLNKVPIGRTNIHLSYLGFESKTISNVVVNSGKEVILNLSMQESMIQMEEVVVTANKNKGEALNDMALLSTRSISPEQTNRYAGGFNDPSRIAANFAGINTTGDGGNDIIIRGNSPKYIQWRLEGIQITNPNHFGDQSAVGGSVSTLNNNLLATSDFHTGAFSPEFGDVLSGIYDVKLRSGNNEKTEAVFGFGILGTDLTLEGPFKKGYAGSYLVNYRFSVATIIDKLGLIDVGGVPKFQDAAFKIVLPTKNSGTFSIFGLSGLSSFLFEDVTPQIWNTPGDQFMNGTINEDYNKDAHLLNVGLNYTKSINKQSYLKASLLYSNEGIEDQVFESRILKIYDNEGEYLRDSTLSRVPNYQGKNRKGSYRAALTYNTKLSAKTKLQIGSKFATIDYKNKQSQLQNDARFTLLDFDEKVSNLRNFVSIKHRLNESITLVGGLHNMNVLLNNKSTLEPRLAFNWQLNSSSSFHAGYGNHSNMESIHSYFAKVEQADGSIIEPNKDLDILKAHHFVIGYKKRFGKNILAKIEAYYQGLYNLPVENNDTSYFATINEGLEFKYVDLVNEGTGSNYGLEFTLERFYANNYYYMINASLFQSKYKSLEGIERNTPFSGNYLVNILWGKEFEKLGKKKNQTLGLNAKIFIGGAKKILPLLRDQQGNLAVDPDNNKFWDYEKAYEKGIEDIYQVTFSASYKWNKPKSTHELFLNIDNLTNTKGKISEFYDEDEPNSIGYLTQFGLFPNLMYRVYF